jgi:MscS family membrane protein
MILCESQSIEDKSKEMIENSIAQDSANTIHSLFSSPGGKILASTITVILLYFLLNLIFKKFVTRKIFRNNLKRYIPLIKIIFWIGAICLISIFILKPTTQTIIVIGIVFLVVIGFASQDFLKNLFAGILILFDKQIQVGDTIQVDNYIGEISQIGLKNIKLITPEKLQVSIQNSEFIKQIKSITDTKESYALVTTEIYLPPKIDLVKVKSIAHRAAMTSRYIYLNKPVETTIKNEINQNQSIIKLGIIAYIFNKQYEAKFSSELTEVIMDELIKQKIIPPYELSYN